MKTIAERLAVLETEHINQSADIKEILTEVKLISVFIHGVDTRVTTIETRQKIYGSVAAAAMTFVAGLSLFKESIIKVFIP